MRGQIRKGLALLGAVLLMAGLAPAQPGMPVAQPTGAPGPDVVAVVNGERISKAQLEAQMEAVRKLSAPMPLHPSAAQRRQRQIEALSMLIDVMLMRQFLKAKTPEVHAAEIERRVREMDAGLKGQGKSLAEHCNDTNQTLAQLKAGIADYLRWNAYVRDQLKDEAVKRFFEENRDVFEENSVRVSHIVFRLPSSATEAERQTARAKLTELRGRILAGQIDFAMAAQKLSQDQHAKDGGDLGYVLRKGMEDEAFSRAAFALKVGEVSDVVQTDYGMHLLKVTERKEGRPYNFEQNKERIKALYSDELLADVLSQQRRAAVIQHFLP